jgi:uncharacterized protein YegP (UPF0339 family)
MSNPLSSIGRLALCGLLAAMIAAVSVTPGHARQAAGGKMTFEIYKDKAGEFRWRLKTADGDILAVPEDAYKNRADAKRAVESIQKNVAKLKAEYTTDKAKKHRWELKASNGRVMARASGGYKTKAEAEKALTSVQAGVKSAAIVEKK